MTKSMTPAEAFQAARNQFNQGNLQQCKDIANDILSQLPNHTDAWLLKAKISRSEGNAGEALEFLLRASHSDPDRSDIYDDMANLATKDITAETYPAVFEKAVKTIKSLEEKTQKKQYSSRVENLYRQHEAFTQLIAILNPRLPLPPFRGWAISPDFGCLIAKYFRITKPQTVLDLGSGNSTLICGYLMESQGSGIIYSVDHEREFLNKTEENINAHKLDNVKLKHAPLESVKVNDENYQWYSQATFDDVNSVDLLIVDGPPGYLQKNSRLPCVEILKSKLNPEACILVDDANRPDERTMVEYWLKQLGDNFEAIWESTTEKGSAIIRKKT